MLMTVSMNDLLYLRRHLNTSRSCICVSSDLFPATVGRTSSASHLRHSPAVSREDDSRAYDAFTEQGSSASQMTAAKVMDLIARLPDTVTDKQLTPYQLTLRVKMEDGPTLLRIPKSECPDIWIRLPRYKRPKSWSQIEDPVVLLERNLCGHPLAGLLWERQFEKVLLELGWEKVSNWECIFVQKKIILIGKRGRHQFGWKEAEHGSHVEEIDDKR